MNGGAQRRVAICVPIRDEARHLPGLFAALAGGGSAQAIVLAMVFDGCNDDSEAIARRLGRDHDVEIEVDRLPRERPDAGRARFAVLTMGRRLVGADGVLLTTDADTRPHRDWVPASLAALGQADLVCGRILRRPGVGETARRNIETYLDRLHRVHRTIDPVKDDATPSHWHEGGASLGMTARAWDVIGREPLAASGEDRQLVRRARLAGLRVRQDPAVRVRTSSRLNGRATGGLADALRHGRVEAAAGIVPMMEHPDDVVARFRRAARTRAAFPSIDGLAAQIEVAPSLIVDAAIAAQSADAFVTALPLVRGPHRALPLPDASVALAMHEGGMS